MVDFAKLLQKERQAEMANAVSINPAIAKLMAHEADWKQARESKNPFKNINNVPDGLYIVKIGPSKLGLTKDKHPSAIFNFICICDEHGSTEFAGTPIRLQSGFKPTDKSTIRDCFDRFCYRLHDMGYGTDTLELGEIADVMKSLHQSAENRYFWASVLPQESNPQYKNVNLVGAPDARITLEQVNEVLATGGNDPIVDSEETTEIPDEAADGEGYTEEGAAPAEGEPAAEYTEEAAPEAAAEPEPEPAPAPTPAPRTAPPKAVGRPPAANPAKAAARAPAATAPKAAAPKAAAPTRPVGPPGRPAAPRPTR